MPSFLGSVPQPVLAPTLPAVALAERLEASQLAVVCGFDWGIAGDDLPEVVRRLELIEAEQRGFAYEGAAMACAIRDARADGTGGRTRELLTGPGAPHLPRIYTGIGLALARLPRSVWQGIVPDHPTMTWLAVDGYGFDLAYRDTRRYVDEQWVPEPYPWAGSPEYFPRAVDQGIGRALWFLNGARPAAVTAAVNRFGEARHPDLWSGVGLAATLAGGCAPEGLTILRLAAGEHWPQLAVGVVFAIMAGTYAGHVPEHSRLAAEALAGLTVPDAVAIADRTESSYERWRDRIRAHFTATALLPVGQGRIRHARSSE
jgi:hypothetical protein